MIQADPTDVGYQHPAHGLEQPASARYPNSMLELATMLGMPPPATSSVLDHLAGWPLGVFGIIVGTLVAYYFYRRSTRAPILACQWDGLTMIDTADAEHPHDIAVHYKGSRVPRLVVTEIIIWNAGDKTVRSEDLLETDPLRIQFDDRSNILSADVVRTTREAVGAESTLDADSSNYVFYRFRFLDPRDGFTLRVVHTGKRISPTLKGTVMGSPSGVRLWGRFDNTPSVDEILERWRSDQGRLSTMDRLAARMFVVKRSSSVSYLLVIYCVGFAAVGTIQAYLTNAATPILFAVAFAAAALAFSVVAWMERPKYPRLLDPAADAAAPNTVTGSQVPFIPDVLPPQSDSRGKQDLAAQK